MPVSRSGAFWRRIFLVLLAIVAGSYIWYSQREFPHGGSIAGLVYGTVAFLLMLLLAFFGVRKRAYRSTFGTLEQWLQSHIYLGLLVFVVLLCHTGGRFNDKVAVTAFILAAIVVFSGMVGAVLYVTVPRLLTEIESNLTPEEISEQLNQLARSMARTASGRSEPFQRVYHELIQESKPGFFAGWRLLLQRVRRRRQDSDRAWTRLIPAVPPNEQEDLRQMLVLSRQRKELLIRLLFQQRYQNILESWLYVHVPFTIALLVVAVVHIVAVFYYARMPW